MITFRDYDSDADITISTPDRREFYTFMLEMMIEHKDELNISNKQKSQIEGIINSIRQEIDRQIKEDIRQKIKGE